MPEQSDLEPRILKVVYGLQVQGVPKVANPTFCFEELVKIQKRGQLPLETNLFDFMRAQDKLRQQLRQETERFRISPVPEFLIRAEFWSTAEQQAESILAINDEEITTSLERLCICSELKRIRGRGALPVIHGSVSYRRKDGARIDINSQFASDTRPGSMRVQLVGPQTEQRERHENRPLKTHPLIEFLIPSHNLSAFELMQPGIERLEGSVRVSTPVHGTTVQPVMLTERRTKNRSARKASEQSNTDWPDPQAHTKMKFWTTKDGTLHLCAKTPGHEDGKVQFKLVNGKPTKQIQFMKVLCYKYPVKMTLAQVIDQVYTESREELQGGGEALTRWIKTFRALISDIRNKKLVPAGINPEILPPLDVDVTSKTTVSLKLLCARNMDDRSGSQPRLR